MRYVAYLWLLLGSVAQADQIIWDSLPNDWPNSRYTVHGDGTVTDTQTRLMWQRCPLGQSGSDCSIGVASLHNWQGALEQVQHSDIAGYTDWRLPNVKEFSSLVATDRINPSINSDVFPRTGSEVFWTSTPFTRSGEHLRGRMVNFENGRNGLSYRSDLYRVRLVRTSE